MAKMGVNIQGGLWKRPVNLFFMMTTEYGLHFVLQLQIISSLTAYSCLNPSYSLCLLSLITRSKSLIDISDMVSLLICVSLFGISLISSGNSSSLMSYPLASSVFSPAVSSFVVLRRPPICVFSYMAVDFCCPCLMFA